jgi:predicted dehydrogenase
VERIRVGIVGVGKIARDQHIPALRANAAFEVVACASRHAGIEGVARYQTLDDMLQAVPALDAVAICTPPQTHFAMARQALRHGKHVLLEKPPCETVGQLEQLEREAQAARRTLFQTWHARHAAGVGPARRWLSGRKIKSGRIVWKEDVRQWHPGQTWLWQAGGFGVFDPGINALSIVSHILPQSVFVEKATLHIPANCQTPIAADLTLALPNDAHIEAAFDFRHTGTQTWDIDIQTDDGSLKLSQGGGALSIQDGSVALSDAEGEYPSLYRRFAQLIGAKTSDVDKAPFQLVCDAFLVAHRAEVEAFHP